MLSTEIEVRTSDSHSIISLTEKKKLNHEKGVFIGDHVWIAKRSLIQKGSVIPEDNIIGFGSMVNKPLIGSNKTFVGVPVKEVKSNVTWSRRASEKKQFYPLTIGKIFHTFDKSQPNNGLAFNISYFFFKN